MKIDCRYLVEDENNYGRCSCPALHRKGPLTALFGSSPACVLIGAQEGATCPHMVLASTATPTSHRALMFAKLGRMERDPFDEDQDP